MFLGWSTPARAPPTRFCASPPGPNGLAAVDASNPRTRWVGQLVDVEISRPRLVERLFEALASQLVLLGTGRSMRPE